MVAAPDSPKRILLGDLEPMVQVGMERVLGEVGHDVFSREGGAGAIVAEAERLLPDAVVLRLDGGVSRELRRRIRAVAPGAKVILWGRDEHEMEVLDPGSTAPRHIRTELTSALLSELRAGTPREGD